MRKIISVVLVALMLFGVMALSASAVVTCDCGNHSGGPNCLCCVNCPDLPQGRRVSCSKLVDGVYTFCCTDCKGYLDASGECGCDAKCTCCVLREDGTIGGTTGSDAIGGALDEVWGEEEQNSFVEGFQAILKKISDVFDNIFDAIFAFLKLDSILGNN